MQIVVFAVTLTPQLETLNPEPQTLNPQSEVLLIQVTCLPVGGGGEMESDFRDWWVRDVCGTS